MRGTNDVEFTGDKGSRATTISNTTDNDETNSSNIDGNGNNGGKGDRIKRSNGRRSGLSPYQFYHKKDQRGQPEYCRNPEHSQDYAVNG